MPHDKTEPRIDLIVGLGVLTMVAFYGVHEGLSSYFDKMVEEEYGEKIASQKNNVLQKMREDEKARAGGVEGAMKVLAQVGRAGNGTDAIRPELSTDLSPRQGALLSPQHPGSIVPLPTPTPPPPAVEDAGSDANSDAATMTATDAGPTAADAHHGH